MHPSKLPILIEQVLYHAEFWYLIAASYTRRVDLILLDQQIRILPADAKHKFFIDCQRATLVAAYQFTLFGLIWILHIVCAAFQTSCNRLALVFVQRD